MNVQFDLERVLLAHKAVRAELLAERNSAGYWEGHLASSPLATATAVSALVAAHRTETAGSLPDIHAGNGHVIEQIVQTDLSEFLVESVQWLARHQNPDGGWGDCLGASSNVAATMLVQAAFRMTGVPAKYADLVDRADEYLQREGGIHRLWERYPADRSFVAAVLANCALAGTIHWRQVPTLQFENACLPEIWRRRVQPAAPRHATPTLIAVGLAKLHHDRPRNPVAGILRRSLRAKAISLLEQLQAADDSFLASTPITAFVVMSLASSGFRDHPITQRGTEFLLAHVRGDASWPAASDRPVTNTALALDSVAADAQMTATSPPQGQAAATRLQHASPARRTENGTVWTLARNSDNAAAPFADETQAAAGLDFSARSDDAETWFDERSLEWLLASQRTEPDVLTGAPAGGWAWSHVSGAVPNANDTARVLATLAQWPIHTERQRERIERSASRGLQWLLNLQSDDGGWPTLEPDGDSSLPAESSAEVTAQVLRALASWRRRASAGNAPHVSNLATQIDLAVERGWQFVVLQQQSDGRFNATWFGNEHQPDEQSPVIGTSLVLCAAAELERLDTAAVHHAVRWLASAQHSSGGWGPPRAPRDYSSSGKHGIRAWRANEAMAKLASVEETALALAALLPLASVSEAAGRAVGRGLNWLAVAVEQDAHRTPAVIGFSLAKIWYYERLYPLVFAAAALSRAVSQLAPQPHEPAHAG